MVIDRPRDSYRSRVYQAEHLAFAPLPSAEGWTVQECQEWVNRVWAQHVRDGFPPRVFDGRGSHRGRASAYQIHLPRWARKPWVILHEMAHSANDRHNRSCKAGHGREWAGLYLYLVRRVLGDEWFHELARQFEARRVPYDAVT